jgi:hypothetical protein
VRDNLSRNQKRKIVEYLDTAQTVEEAKTIYRRIKKILDESAKNKTEVKPENKAGSSSSKSSSGSAANLNESVENRNSSGVTKERFMALAGIKKKDK